MSPPKTKVREAYLGEVRQESNRLNPVPLYPRGGALTSLEYDIRNGAGERAAVNN